jgi:Cu/Ag efflux protein CusF
MTLVLHPVWALAALLLAADADIIEETGAEGVFFGHGVVKAIEPGTGALTLDHDAIKGCMPAMEMMFRVARPDVSRDLKLGDAINFRIDGARYVILEATVAGRPTPGL